MNIKNKLDRKIYCSEYVDAQLKIQREKIVEDLEDLRYDYQYNNLNLKSFLDIIKKWEK